MARGPSSTTFRKHPGHHPYPYRVGWKRGVTLFLASREGAKFFFEIAGQNCSTPPPGNKRPLPKVLLDDGNRILNPYWIF